MLKEAWMLAIETLSWIKMQKLNERLALSRTVKQLCIKDADAIRLAHLLVCETVKRQNFIDNFINDVLKPKEISEFDLGVQAFLGLYVYQTQMARNRSQIDVKEAENIVKMGRSILGWKTLQKVEPFLGLLLTQKPAITFENLADDEKIGLHTFHPSWFVRYCFKLLGRRETIVMLKADTQALPTYIRLNTLKTDEKTILSRLTEENIKIKKVEQLKHAYEVVSARKPLNKTSSFREGLFYLQDKASCFAAEAANPQNNMTVLDVCAAPGAKTTYLAQLMQNYGAIYSIDYSKRRMTIWKEEVSRMNVKIAEPVIVDARDSLPFTIGTDLVILDPPCTSSGTFRKLPSAKWRLTPRSIERMAEIQWQMLNNCAEHVKSQGTLVYATCSITVEENEMQIERFLKHHPQFSLTEITPKIGFSGLRGLEKCQRLYPHTHNCNGFFIARLIRRD